MRLRIPNSTENALTLMRRSGYSFQYEERGEASYVRSLSRSGYPRFHCYVKSGSHGLEISIHLDQKRETYGRVTRHHGEYLDEGALAEEVKRMEGFIGPFERL